MVIKLFTTMLSLILFMASGVLADSESNIFAMQKEIENQGKNWIYADNPILHLSDNERKGMLLHDLPNVKPGDFIFQPDSSKELPQRLDWRDNGGNFITSAKNQATCGSCWAFASVAQLEAQDAVTNSKIDPQTNLSEQFLVSCMESGTCDGGWHNDAFDFIIENGVPDDSCFPYIEDNGSCSNACEDWESRTMTLESWSWISTDNIGETGLIKTALMDGPVSSVMEIHTDFYGYSGGVYDQIGFSYEGHHVVLLIGWDDAEQAWIAKNSWGTEWGINGFFKIKYQAVRIGMFTTKIEVIESTCNINGKIYQSGPNPENACQICDPLENPFDWDIIPDGQPCDDGLFCNGSGICVEGSCSNDTDDPCPDDEYWCNGLSYCDEDSDSCKTTGSPCLATELCEEELRECVTANSKDDDDNAREDDSEESSCGN